MNIALLGYGKMGKTIEALAKDAGDNVVLKVDISNAASWTAEELRKADVAIEFSRPDVAVDNMYRCFDAGVPVVVGTTGWLDRLEEVKKNCEAAAASLFYASNFSIGVNLFFELNKVLARLMDHQPDYQKVYIHESHHVHKLDAPSGTAISIADQLVAASSRFESWESHSFSELSTLKADLKKLPVFYSREDEVPGTHTVHYSSSVDEIEIRHLAYSREGFAKGALAAARWLQGKKGVFTMNDLLKLH